MLLFGDSALPCSIQGLRGARPATKTGGTRTGSLQVSARVPRPSRGYKSGAPRRKVTIRIFEDLERSKALRIAPRSPELSKMEPQYDEARAFQVAREHAVEVRRACRDALETAASAQRNRVRQEFSLIQAEAAINLLRLELCEERAENRLTATLAPNASITGSAGNVVVTPTNAGDALGPARTLDLPTTRTTTGGLAGFLTLPPSASGARPRPSAWSNSGPKIPETPGVGYLSTTSRLWTEDNAWSHRSDLSPRRCRTSLSRTWCLALAEMRPLLNPRGEGSWNWPTRPPE